MYILSMRITKALKIPRFQVTIYRKNSARASRSHYLFKAIHVLFMTVTKRTLKSAPFSGYYIKKFQLALHARIRPIC